MIKVFISYATEDREILDKLRPHFNSMSHGFTDLQFWSEEDIEPGRKVDAAIEESLGDSDIYVALLSANFVSSSRLFADQLPTILTRCDRAKRVLFPIYCAPCMYDGTLLSGRFLVMPFGRSLEENKFSSESLVYVSKKLSKTIENFRDGTYEIDQTSRFGSSYFATVDISGRQDSISELRHLLGRFEFALGEWFLGAHEADHAIYSEITTIGDNSFEASMYKLGRIARRYKFELVVSPAPCITVYNHLTGQIEVFSASEKAGIVSCVTKLGRYNFSHRTSVEHIIELFGLQ